MSKLLVNCTTYFLHYFAQSKFVVVLLLYFIEKDRFGNCVGARFNGEVLLEILPGTNSRDQDTPRLSNFARTFQLQLTDGRCEVPVYQSCFFWMYTFFVNAAPLWMAEPHCFYWISRRTFCSTPVRWAAGSVGGGIWCASRSWVSLQWAQKSSRKSSTSRCLSCWSTSTPSRNISTASTANTLASRISSRSSQATTLLSASSASVSSVRFCFRRPVSCFLHTCSFY